MQDSAWVTKASKIVLSRPNDAILIDNWRILHGRGPVKEHEMHRHLQRVYLMEVFK
jgi:hypothetical protein